MKKQKYIQDNDELDYKRRLAEFMQSINPKDRPEVLEKIKQQYQLAREPK